MRQAFLFLLPFVFFSCASGSRILSETQRKQEEDSTKNCLKHPDLGRSWGECNFKKVIHNRIPQIRRCYEKKMGETIHFEGDVILKIRVYRSGRVREVNIDQGSLKNKYISECLIREIGKVRFATPPEDYGNVVSFPFLLEKLNRPESKATTPKL